jgi:protein SCO1/2
MRQLLVAINVLLVFAILGVAFYWQPAPDQSPMPGTQAARMVDNVTLADTPQGGDFMLNGPRGTVALHDFAGKLVVLEFGYTYCPDICPTSLTIMAQALGGLTKDELAKVQPIFVSVDPERDTVARLVEYTGFFHPAILGLTGPADRLPEIARRYGATFVRHESASAGGYVIDHTALTYLIGPDGRLIASLPHGTPAEQLLAEIRKQLPTH